MNVSAALVKSGIFLVVRFQPVMITISNNMPDILLYAICYICPLCQNESL